MNTFQSLTLCYGLACLTSGAVQEMMPQAESRKVIKAVSGLYILLVLLHGASDLSAAGLSFSLPEAESTAQSTAYRQDVVEDTDVRLEAGCNTQLEAQGLAAKVNFTLAQRESNVYVSLAEVSSQNRLSPEQKQEVLDVLKDYAPARIVFQNGEDAQ
ncbi:MAG: hypothetical protein LKJ90_03020 [Faecalibacterium sp.]|jgi:DNA polymerase III delta prime subunit|nr:hypothetical protein [Faecalibacterium sp.]